MLTEPPCKGGVGIFPVVVCVGFKFAHLLQIVLRDEVHHQGDWVQVFVHWAKVIGGLK